MSAYDDILDSSQGVAPERVEDYLTDLAFPASKNQIMQSARYNRATNEVLETLSNLPERVYSSFDQFDYYLKRSMYYH